MMNRNQSLDVLRGIAILLVLGHHFPAQPTLAGTVDASSTLPRYARIWFSIGWTGVELFFVLSGYLISGLLFHDYQQFGHIRLRRFMFRRFMKIWPPLYALLLVTALLIAYRPERFPWRLFLSSVFFYRNYLPLHAYPSVLSHTWSLGVEEHFYLLLPLLLIFLVSHKRDGSDPFSALPWIFCGMALVSSVLRGFSAEPMASHMKMDSLFAGVLLRYLHLHKPAWFAEIGRSRWLIAVPFLLTTVFLTHGAVRNSIGIVCLYAAFSLLLTWSVLRTAKGILPKLVAHTGECSYSIYLWHVPVAMIVSAWQVSAIAFWIYIACALAVGIGMSKLVEIPVLHLRDRITEARQWRSREVTVSETVPVI